MLSESSPILRCELSLYRLSRVLIYGSGKICVQIQTWLLVFSVVSAALQRQTYLCNYLLRTLCAIWSKHLLFSDENYPIIIGNYSDQRSLTFILIIVKQGNWYQYNHPLLSSVLWNGLQLSKHRSFVFAALLVHTSYPCLLELFK